MSGPGNVPVVISPVIFQYLKNKSSPIKLSHIGIENSKNMNVMSGPENIPGQNFDKFENQ